MKIAEVTYTINKNGVLRIPAASLNEMGLAAGDQVRIAYLTSDGIRNDYKEFLISGNSANDSMDEDPQISIPSGLLDQANIPQEADLQIVCCEGCIVITRDAVMSVNEMAALLSALETADGIASQFPAEINIQRVGEQIRAAINDAQEGSGSE